MHGGFRPGAGRKSGFAAKNAEEARSYLSRRVAEEIAPLTDALMEKAKGGDMRALQILLDRAWGRPRQEVEFVQKEVNKPPDPRIWELAKRLNQLPIT